MIVEQNDRQNDHQNDRQNDRIPTVDGRARAFEPLPRVSRARAMVASLGIVACLVALCLLVTTAWEVGWLSWSVMLFVGAHVLAPLVSVSLAGWSTYRLLIMRQERRRREAILAARRTEDAARHQEGQQEGQERRLGALGVSRPLKVAASMGRWWSASTEAAPADGDLARQIAEVAEIGERLEASYQRAVDRAIRDGIPLSIAAAREQAIERAERNERWRTSTRVIRVIRSDGRRDTFDMETGIRVVPVKTAHAKLPPGPERRRANPFGNPALSEVLHRWWNTRPNVPMRRR